MGQPPQDDQDAPELTTFVAQYIHDSLTRDVPEDVLDRQKKHLFDTFIAVISGSALRPGSYATEFVRRRQAAGEATVAGSGLRTSPELAALANGMFGHADETDDTNDLSRMHPGTSILPGTLAVAEDRDRSGRDFLHAAVAGYDVGCSFPLSLWEPGRTLRQSVQSTHGIGQLFGAMAGAAALADLSVEQLRWVISYTAQQASGLSSIFRDTEHIEKAFGMGGKQAHNGVTAVEMVSLGFTGVDDVLDTSPSLYDAWGTGGEPKRLVQRLTEQFQVMNCDIKRYPVGMPIQAAAQTMDEMIASHGLRADDVEHVECRLPTEKAHIVDDRPMPDINLQYILAIMLLDGRCTFDAAHDYDRLHDPDVRALMAKVDLIHDDELNPPPSGDGSSRRAIITATLTSGETVEHRVDPPRGTRLNPVEWDDLEVKAKDVLGGILATSSIDALLTKVQNLEHLDSVRELRPLLVTS